MKSPTDISDYLLLTGGSRNKPEVIHITTTDPQESCVLERSDILDDTWYATGGIYENDIYLCGGASARPGGASSKSQEKECTVYSNEKDEKPVVIPLRQNRIKAASATSANKELLIVGKFLNIPYM